MTRREFQDAFDTHKDAVHRFAFRLTGSASAAEDLAQECFVQLLTHPERFDAGRGSARAYLFGITRNLALNRWRAESRWGVARRGF